MQRQCDRVHSGIPLADSERHLVRSKCRGRDQCRFAAGGDGRNGARDIERRRFSRDTDQRHGVCRPDRTMYTSGLRRVGRDEHHVCLPVPRIGVRSGNGSSRGRARSLAAATVFGATLRKCADDFVEVSHRPPHWRKFIDDSFFGCRQRFLCASAARSAMLNGKHDAHSVG